MADIYNYEIGSLDELKNIPSSYDIIKCRRHVCYRFFFVRSVQLKIAHTPSIAAVFRYANINYDMYKKSKIFFFYFYKSLPEYFSHDRNARNE